MFNGVPLAERIKRLVERQMTILESFVKEDEPGGPLVGLSADQLEQLETIARLVRQLELDTLKSSSAPQEGVAATAGMSLEEMIAAVPGKK
jgi:hypothetical protein